MFYNNTMIFFNDIFTRKNIILMTFLTSVHKRKFP